MNQDQANAIAEREYPCDTKTRFGSDYRTEHQMGSMEGYAKCLMDMNPLIEAGEHLSEAVKWSHDDADYKAPEQFTKTYVYGRYLNPLTKKAVEFDTALSNLTKNIEP